MSPLWAEEMSQWTPQEAQKDLARKRLYSIQAFGSECPQDLKKFITQRKKEFCSNSLQTPQEFLAPTTAVVKGMECIEMELANLMNPEEEDPCQSRDPNM